MPGLVPAIAHRTAALDVEGDRGQAMRPVERQGRDELAGIAFRIPGAVAPGPHAARLGILVVDDAVDHPGGEELALDLAAAEGPAGIGWLAVDMERIAHNGDAGGAAARGGRSGTRAHSRHQKRRTHFPDHVTTALGHETSPTCSLVAPAGGRALLHRKTAMAFRPAPTTKKD